MIDVADKRDFLVWLINNVSFQRREVIWILNYLINHEAILKNIHIVEQADKTPRGLIFRDASQPEDSMILTISGQPFTSSDQIFHEIRLHWQQPLYLECIFPNSWQNPQYLSVLEDNPAVPWNEVVSPEIIQEVELYMAKEAQTAQLQHLYQQIDEALEKGEQEAFLELSEEINRLNLSIKEKELSE